MWIVDDPDGTPVELTFERWRHIVEAHPELTPGRAPNERWHYLLGAGPSRWLKVVVAYEPGRGYGITAFARRAFP